MGHFGCSFHFSDLPNIEIIKYKICNYSGLDVVLVNFPRIELYFELEHKSLEMDIMVNFPKIELYFELEHKSLEMDILVEISITTNEPISKIYLSCISDKIDKQYYFYRLISAVLVDLGGLADDRLSFPTWAREKWQGQKWFTKVTRSPHFLGRIFGFKTSL